MKFPKIGIVGMGWVGRNYALDFENRGYKPICYSLEDLYRGNKELIKDCDFVFLAVPTPTSLNGPNYSILHEALKLVGKGKIVVIKSTILPGTTIALQIEYQDLIIIHSPEFLSTVTAEYDAANPKRNIIGIPFPDKKYVDAANCILELVAKAPFEEICSSMEAELIKYAHNCGGYLQVVFYNILYDICNELGGDWSKVKLAIASNFNFSNPYLDPVHKNGRGAGGTCFIKDFSAFNYFYNAFNDPIGKEMLEAIQKKNISLLINSNKDLDILESVFKFKSIDFL